ncbi:MAG: hypothetical protein GWO04_20575, partial [Actinobacteria bacterium]|nr:hypothetical protein [Actinomycetota bacterium]
MGAADVVPACGAAVLVVVVEAGAAVVVGVAADDALLEQAAATSATATMVGRMRWSTAGHGNGAWDYCITALGWRTR